jgi:hypothetical protein
MQHRGGGINVQGIDHRTGEGNHGPMTICNALAQLKPLSVLAIANMYQFPFAQLW